MTEHADLLAACVAHPEDDAPRLVWADAVGGERGELVVLQCRLARGELSPAESGWLRRRQRELLGRHGADWSELRGIARRARFRRGFVEAIEMDPAAVTGEVFDRAPLVRALTTPSMSTGTASPDAARAELAAFLASPWLQRLHGFHIVRPTYTADYGDDVWLADSYAVEVFARAKAALGHLRAFGSDDAIGAARLRELGVFGGITRLWHHEDSGPADLVALVSTLPLVELDLGGSSLRYDILQHLPNTLRSLRLRVGRDKPWDGILAQLAASPCARSLERLSLTSGRVMATSLAHFPRLHSLDLRDVRLAARVRKGTTDRQDEAIELFVATPMPALRELRPFANLTPRTLRPIVERLGPQLELLDLRGCGELRTVGDAIDATVAGDVRYGMRPDDTELLLADGGAPEPWWEETTIRL